MRAINYSAIGDKKKKSIKIKEQAIYFKDDGVASYYQNEHDRSLKSIFVQRIKDSGMYILLFPTGLLMLLSTNLFQIQSKLQLNLKKDESIIDIAYCIHEDNKLHCLWLIDEKLQVWKCSNELNPISCNWTLIKVSMFNNLFYRRFLQPAMTYQDFFVTSSLNGIDCFRDIDLEDLNQVEFMFSFNQSSTKSILVKQPNIRFMEISYLDP